MSHLQTLTPRFQVSRAEAEAFAEADLDHVLHQLTLDEKIAFLTVSMSVGDRQFQLMMDDLCFVGSRLVDHGRCPTSWNPPHQVLGRPCKYLTLNASTAIN
jgi:hypothetical protein